MAVVGNNRKVKSMRIKGLKRKYKKRLSEQCKDCQHLGSGCFNLDNEHKCATFLSKYKTNLTRVDMIVETNQDIDWDMLSQKFTNWISSNGWDWCGSISPYEDKE